MRKFYSILLMLIISSTACWAARDPTSPPSANPFVLSAIMFSSGQQTAIINQRLVQVQDTIDGFRVIKITPYKVILVGADGILTLPLIAYSIKAPG